MKYIKYLIYILRHKWFVFIECFKMKIIWRGIFHDLSKFRPSEFIPYANHFYGEKASDINKGRDSSGYYEAGNTGDLNFDIAWFYHQKRNRHHWQWWIIPINCNCYKILSMDEDSIKEIVCDWVGAGKAINGKDSSVNSWYNQNKDKITLNTETRRKIEEILKLYK